MSAPHPPPPPPPPPPSPSTGAAPGAAPAANKGARARAQAADGRYHNRFDRGPAGNCAEFWSPGWPDPADVYEEDERVRPGTWAALFERRLPLF